MWLTTGVFAVFKQYLYTNTFAERETNYLVSTQRQNEPNILTQNRTHTHILKPSEMDILCKVYRMGVAVSRTDVSQTSIGCVSADGRHTKPHSFYRAESFELYESL